MLQYFSMGKSIGRNSRRLFSIKKWNVVFKFSIRSYWKILKNILQTYVFRERLFWNKAFLKLRQKSLVNDSFIHSASGLLFLIPTVITKVPLNKDAFQQIIEMYGKDLPNKDVADIELSSWKRKWLERDEKFRPKTIASLLKKCSKYMYPNLSVLLKLAANPPEKSCECERSFSVLRRLRTWLRASMITKSLWQSLLFTVESKLIINVQWKNF